jgi:hypothetical protein
VWVVCAVLGAFAWAQEDGQSAPAAAAIATVPRLIRINGSVRDEAGNPRTGNIAVTFTLYNDEGGQVAVWQESQNVKLDASGRYNALLGASNESGLPLEIFSAGQARWLGVRPEGQAEQPRVLFLSVAYALKAADTDMLGGRPASAYALAGNQNSQAQPTGTQMGSINSGVIVASSAGSSGSGNLPLLVSPQTACSAITSDGTATANQVTKFTTACNIENSAIFESGGNVGIGTTSPGGVLDVNGAAVIRGSLSLLEGTVLGPVSTATASAGYASSPLDLEASVYNSATSSVVDYLYRWQTGAVGNDTGSPGGVLNLLYGVPGSVIPTGFSIAHNGIITFASGQTFPGATGTVTSVATGAGLTGGPITTSGTISIPSAGVTNAMLANNSITVTAGSGLSGGGTVALGGTVTITNASPSSGGTVTSVATGTGLSGGPITGSGTLSLNTTYTDGRYLQLAGGALTGALSGTTGTFSGALSGTTGAFSGALSAAGASMPGLGTATASKGYNSNALDFLASSYSSKTAAAVAQDFRWQAEASGNDTASPSGTLNLLFGSNGTAPAETGLSIGSTGLINFATGQTFPGTGSGTVTSVATGAGLSGGPITGSGTISIPSAGVTNAMLANNSITVTAGSGLSGGGTVALGGTVTITNASPSSGGTVTNVATGAGLAGGPITGTGTISIPSAGVTNAMLANNSITVTAGSGLSGGGTVALGGTVTITNASPGSGGTVTSVASGTGLTGGPITGSGTLSLNTTYTDGRYLQLAGGTLTGALSGTTGTFSGALSGTTGTFSGALTAGGALLPGTGTATASKGYISNPFDLQTSSYSSKTAAAVTQDFRWQAEPSGNDTASPSGTLNLLFGSNGTAPAETGLSIASTGLITFATGQTFPGTGGGTVTSVATGAGLTGGPITGTGTISIPSAGVTNAMLVNPFTTVNGQTCTLGASCTIATGSGTVTSVATGAGLTGGPITASGTISIPSAGVTNAMLANNSVTVTAGSGLSGGGTVALGGTVTLNNTGVTSVATGAGLTGGPITGSGTISIPSAGVSNAMLANNSITVTAGSGLSGGGTVALGGTVTITNTSPSLGGTVTSVASGTGLTGGPITGSGTLSLNTTYTDGRYLQLAGGTLTGGLVGTTGTFSGALSGTTGTFSGALTASGAVLPGTGTATSSKGYISNPFDLQTSSYSSKTAAAVTQDFRWQAEPAGNDTASPSGVLNLLFGSNGATPAETGLSIASTGLITFATGQTFPGAGSGTVTSIATGAGLTGGPITGSGTISIPSAGVTNAMLVNPFTTVNGQTCTLGASCTIATGTGTVTSVATGAGLAGGPITGSGTISIPSAGVTNTMLANSSVTVTAGSGLSGGGAIALGGSGSLNIAAGGVTNAMLANNSITVTAGSGLSGGGTVALGGTVTLNNTGGTVTSVATGAGLTGGPITGSGTISIPTAGVTNAMLVNPFTTVNGQTCGLGASCTIATGTVTSVATGAGLTGGPITGSGTISIPSAGVTNSMLANNSITVTAGSGLSGGGTVALGGTVTITNTAPGLGGTVTSVGSGTGLIGGPITSNGTLSLDTSFTDGRYLQLAGGTLTGGLSGTTGTFSGALSATTGTFSSPVSEAGALLTPTGAATSSQGFNSNALDLQASAYNSTSASAVAQDFLWQTEPSQNNSSSPSGTLNLLFGSNGATPAETGLSIANNGIITFASGQTFPNGGGTGGGGTVTSIATGPGLTGGPITSAGTISIPVGGVANSMLANPGINVVAGSGLSGGGSVALGGTVTLASNLAGTTDGIAYFSSPSSVASTPAPTNGQILIGSTGNAPVLSTLTAGSNVTITNSPGEITISAAGGGGGAPTLPFFATGGGRTGGTQAATVNVTKLWGFLLPYNVTTTQITYDVTTADKTANDYDIGIFTIAGSLVVDLGPVPGSTFSATAGFKTLAWTQGSTSLAPGEYYLGFTTNCATACAKVAAAATNISFAINASAGASTGGALPSTVTPPANNWNTGDQPAVVIH